MAIEEGPFELAAALDRPGHDLQGQDIGPIVGLAPCGVTIASDLARGVQDADVAVDFSSPQSLAALIEACVEAKCAIVSGTTGLDPRTHCTLEEAASRIPMVIAPNMSVGMNLLLSITEKASAALGPEYDAEIIELHHREKKDAPSGTAIRLAETVANTRGAELKEVGRYSRHGASVPRKHGEIGLMAVRAGDIVGEHTVLFAGPKERVELTHRVASRANFASGALKAALWVSGRSSGRYDMRDVLGL
jgi:4-hydroxy-tetrahydrodipicolinate reductase